MASDDSKTSLVLGVAIFTLLFSGLVITLRIYARSVIQRGALGLDDLFIVLAWILTLTYNAFMFASAAHGYGQRNVYLSNEEYVQVVKYEVFGQIFAVMAYIPSKASVAICLGRIFPSKKLRWVLWIIPSLNALGFIQGAFVQIFLCSPVPKQWDQSISGSCINPQIFVDCVLLAGSIGIASDFALAIIPIYYVAKLQMRRREKFAIGVALSLGMVAGCFAIVKTYYITTLSARTDYAYETVPLVLWSIGEQCAINVAASIPMLRPLFQRYFPQLSNSSRISKSHENTTFSYGSYSRAFKGSKPSDSGFMELSNQTGNQILVEDRIESTSYPAHTL